MFNFVINFDKIDTLQKVPFISRYSWRSSVDGNSENSVSKTSYSYSAIELL